MIFEALAPRIMKSILFAGISQNVYENKERDLLKPLRSQNVDDNKPVIRISQNVTERKRLAGLEPRKNTAFP
jgi:hypothetical protein